MHSPNHETFASGKSKMTTPFQQLHLVEPHIFLGGQKISQPVSKASLGKDASPTGAGIFFNGGAI